MRATSWGGCWSSVRRLPGPRRRRLTAPTHRPSTKPRSATSKEGGCERAQFDAGRMAGAQRVQFRRCGERPGLPGADVPRLAGRGAANRITSPGAPWSARCARATTRSCATFNGSPHDGTHGSPRKSSVTVPSCTARIHSCQGLRSPAVACRSLVPVAGVAGSAGALDRANRRPWRLKIAQKCSRMQLSGRQIIEYQHLKMTTALCKKVAAICAAHRCQAVALAGVAFQCLGGSGNSALA